MQHRVSSLNSGMSIFVLRCGGFDRDSDILIGPRHAAKKNGYYTIMLRFAAKLGPTPSPLAWSFAKLEATVCGVLASIDVSHDDID